jgi:hypothetical protein
MTCSASTSGTPLTRRRLTAALVLSVLAVAACATAALAITGALHGVTRPAAQAVEVSGAFRHANSRSGAAILGATAMRPGDVATGDVTITNSGDLAGVFHLGSSIATEAAGAGGGRLPDRLLLRIVDATDPAAPVELWAGPLSSFTGRGLGTLQPHDGRTYRISATFPDTGAGGDNAFAGASTSVSFAWTATAISPPAAAPPVPAPAQPPGNTTAPPRSIAVRTPGAVITLLVSGGCVRRGGVLRATLRWKKQRRKGSVFVKVRRTDFFIGRRRVVVDLRAPFALRFKVPLATAPGSALTLRARAYIKVRHGRGPKKSLSISVRICP